MRPFAALFLGLLAAGAAPAAEDIIRLPPFEVAGVRPWLYASIPGYEILSLENAKDTQRIVEQVQRSGRFLPLFFPAGQRLDFAAPSTLFIDRYSKGSVLAEARQKLGIPGKIGTYTVVAKGFAVQFTAPDVVASWQAGRTSPSGTRFYGTVLLARPILPSWYQDGLTALLQTASMTDTRIEFSARTWVTATLMPLAEVLAVTTQAKAIAGEKDDPAFRIRYLTAAGLFIRWGFFSSGGSLRAAFIDFAASRLPPDDDACQRYFGMTAEGVRTSMLAFALGEGRRAATLTLPKDQTAKPLAPVVVRPATSPEVARLVGTSYLALAESPATDATRTTYRTMARTILAVNDAFEGRDLRLVAALGQLEYDEGHYDRAREYLRAAQVAQPNVLLMQAMLRLDEAGAKLGDGKRLAPVDVSRVIEPLQASLQLQPRLYEAYRLLADLRLRALEPVAKEELALLAEGVREYPRADETALVVSVARLHLQNGRADLAREMVERRLAQGEAEGIPAGSSLRALKEQLDLLLPRDTAPVVR